MSLKELQREFPKITKWNNQKNLPVSAAVKVLSFQGWYTMKTAEVSFLDTPVTISSSFTQLGYGLFWYEKNN